MLLTGEEVRQVRGDIPQAIFGQAVRESVAAILGCDLDRIPSIDAGQVSRWEQNGLPGTKLASVAYAMAIERLGDQREHRQ